RAPRAPPGAAGPPCPPPAGPPCWSRRAATPWTPWGPMRWHSWTASRAAERSYLPTRRFARYVLTSGSSASRLAPPRLTASGCAKVGHVGGQPARQGFESPHPDQHDHRLRGGPVRSSPTEPPRRRPQNPRDVALARAAVDLTRA